MALEPKAIEPRSARSKEAQENWKKIDALFYRTIGHAETAFKVNVGINIIIVIIGIALIAYAISYSWIKSLDLYSTAFGTLGVVSFIATFFLTPQRNIEENVGNLTQIQICYRTYAAQWEAINDHLYYHEKEMSIEDLQKINEQLETLTCKTVEEIQKFIKSKETPKSGDQSEEKPNA
jgi:ABC-type multidrug transport system fused ATPase/permease subunit